jgi:hypothetical protein
MEAQSSSKTSVITRATRRNIPENAILHSHRRENLKSCMQTVQFKTTLIFIYKLGIPDGSSQPFDGWK